MRGRAGADLDGVHRVLPPIDHRLFDAVFDKGRGVGHAVEPGAVRLVLGKEQVGRARADQAIAPQVGVRGDDGGCGAVPVSAQDGAGSRAGACIYRGFGVAPTPGIAEPERRQEVQGRGVGAAIGGL